MKYESIPLISVLLSVLLLPGCGGGGDNDDPTTIGGESYSGSTTQATVDASNAKELSTGATSSTQQAVASDAISDIAMRPQPSPASRLAHLAPRIAQWIDKLDSTTAARTEDLSSNVCDFGGSAVVTGNDAGTSGSITFTNCAISDSQDTTVRVNGEVTFISNSGADTVSMTFRVTVDYIGESRSVNMSLACNNVSTESVSCSISSDFTGIDDRVYRIEDLTVSGDRFSGFYVSMRHYDPDYGWVDVTTSIPFIYNCANGMPGSGMITVSGSGGSFATASFDSCSSYTVTVDGVGSTYNW